MANAKWVQTGGNNTAFHKATIDSANTATEVLTPAPNSKVSLSITVGASESVTLEWGNFEDGTLTGAKTITSNYEDTFLGSVTAIKLSGASSNASTISVVEVRNGLNAS